MDGNIKMAKDITKRNVLGSLTLLSVANAAALKDVTTAGLFERKPERQAAKVHFAIGEKSDFIAPAVRVIILADVATKSMWVSVDNTLTH